MTPEKWKKITKIYHSAIELEPAERKAFLDKRCANDESLRAEVESLLLADAEAGNFLDQLIIKDTEPFQAVENKPSLIGKQLGNYKTTGFKLEKVDREFNDRYIREAQASIGDKAFEAASEKGRSMRLKEAIKLARETD